MTFFTLRLAALAAVLLFGCDAQSVRGGATVQESVTGGSWLGWSWPWPWHHRHHRKNADVANEFPTLNETLEMARLSSIVYEFRDEDDSFCVTYRNETGLSCQFYFHDVSLGTQVLVVLHELKEYIAIVFAGTDDLRTSLADVNINQKPFGSDATGVHLNGTTEAKVHAGFDNAVFSNVTLWAQVTELTKALTQKHKDFKVFTAGHSLGGANAVLTAIALALDEVGFPDLQVTSISFGCPQTGNIPWFEYFNASTSLADSHAPLRHRLGVWRVVMGWDLVPRLPEFFSHVGHTIQLWNVEPQPQEQEQVLAESAGKILPLPVEVYYQHYGDPNLKLASVPSGWYSKSFIWVPSALTSHFVKKYIDHLELLQASSQWVTSFVKVPDDDNGNKDDDDWVEPPDDTYPMSYFDQHAKVDIALRIIEESDEVVGPENADEVPTVSIV